MRRGLTIKDVEDGTKIRSKYLQALEEDDFESIPGATFVKGFMRTYAEFLDLDADSFVYEYRSAYENQPDPHQIRPLNARPRSNSGRRSSNHVVVGIVALIAIVVLLWLGSSLGWGRGEEPAEITADTVTEEMEGAAGETTDTSLGEIQPETTAPETQTSLEQGAAPTDSSGEATAAAETTSTLPAAGGAVQVVAQADGGRCWLLARDGSAEGEILYSGTLEEGEEVTFSSEQAVWMNVGSPAALSVSVNGAAIEVPEPYGNFLLTAGGIERTS